MPESFYRYKCLLTVLSFILTKVYNNTVYLNNCSTYFSHFVSHSIADRLLYLFSSWSRDVLNMELVSSLVESNNFLGSATLRYIVQCTKTRKYILQGIHSFFEMIGYSA